MNENIDENVEKGDLKHDVLQAWGQEGQHTSLPDVAVDYEPECKDGQPHHKDED